MTFQFDTEHLKSAVARFQGRKILVLGDVMLDRFIWGKVSRISPEAPVPVVEVERETYMLGGAANVVHNLSALGAEPVLCGLVGQDEDGHLVAELLDELEVPPEGLLQVADRPTTTKTRVVAHSQQVVRVDREQRRAMSQADVARLLEVLDHLLPSCEALIVSDYAKGVICKAVMEPLLASLQRTGFIVTVDPKVANLSLYRGATVITPNHLEALAAAQVEAELPQAVSLAGKKLLTTLGVGHVLVTQGEKGMTLFSPDREDHIPTVAKQVYDVTGAGDTVISTLTLGLVAGLSPRDAALLANFAAGQVVGDVGTSAVTAGQLPLAVEQGARALGKVV
ncbi:MAG: D-glycero-beta-D-manno-heptose-7-phosphate kinase [Deltaproteobacteria bacterium]|nr:D-glycero-beta-D-manno-heptose-7-phosphate kinase [Deltaproteobacteria bacterium]